MNAIAQPRRRGRPQLFTDEQRAEVIALGGRGLTVREIEARTGLEHLVVYRILANDGKAAKKHTEGEVSRDEVSAALGIRRESARLYEYEALKKLRSSAHRNHVIGRIRNCVSRVRKLRRDNAPIAEQWAVAHELDDLCGALDWLDEHGRAS